MDLKLEDIAQCFHGVVPAVMATASKSGEPNVTYLSHVYFVDSNHVALSCQFFNKTRSNIVENPRACIELNDPFTFQGYRLELRFVHAESEGPLFDHMRSRLDTIAFHTGMHGCFRLLSADVYEVLSVEKIEGYLVDPVQPAPSPDSNGPMNEIRSLQLVSSCMHAATSLEELLEGTLRAMDEALGFDHSMILLADENARTLYTVASRGYGESGVGAEVEFGAGLIGRAAILRQVLRTAGMSTELRYGRAIREQLTRAGSAPDLPEVPLPGLQNVQSQMALPVVMGSRLLGVLAVESSSPLRFEHWHQDFLQIITNQFALALDRMSAREEMDQGRAPGASASDVEVLAPPAPTREPPEQLPEQIPEQVPEPPEQVAEPGDPRQRHVFWFFPNDDCVFVDGEYLVRNVPGRILWRLLSDYQHAGRREFTNRELRLDQSLGLPPIKDNLESRLILLRRRLQEKCPHVRLTPILRRDRRAGTRGAERLDATGRR